MEKNDKQLHEKAPVNHKTPQPLKERIYDQIHIPLKALDAIIVLLIAAVIACIVIGALKGNNLI